MPQIVINSTCGGFSISTKALERLNELGADLEGEWEAYTLYRSDPLLLQVVRELKTKASGLCARLVIVEIPDGVEWTIEECNGYEWVAEKHRKWEAPE